jgi:hypothetical protein
MNCAMSAAAFALAASLVSRAAAAEAPTEEPEVWEPGGDHEWSLGVPQEARASARALFQSGRELLHESLTIAAAEKFREALKVWDHPGIHYNLALALMAQDRPLELREHLIAAQRYGPWPIKEHRFEHAKTYLALLESQLVKLSIRCDVPGAQVSLDGEPLLTPPGEVERWAKAGSHVVTASKDGYVANQVARVFSPGAKIGLELELKTQGELTVYERRWPAWKPWALIGAGAAVAVAGGALHYAALRTFKSADESAVDCRSACTPQPELSRAHNRGTTMQRAAIASYSVGGAAIAVGGVLAYSNRTRPYIRPYTVDVRSEPLVVAPAVGAHSLGLLAKGRF